MGEIDCRPASRGNVPLEGSSYLDIGDMGLSESSFVIHVCKCTLAVTYFPMRRRVCQSGLRMNQWCKFQAVQTRMPCTTRTRTAISKKIRRSSTARQSAGKPENEEEKKDRNRDTARAETNESDASSAVRTATTRDSSRVEVAQAQVISCTFRFNRDAGRDNRDPGCSSLAKQHRHCPPLSQGQIVSGRLSKPAII